MRVLPVRKPTPVGLDTLHTTFQARTLALVFNRLCEPADASIVYRQCSPDSQVEAARTCFVSKRRVVISTRLH